MLARFALVLSLALVTACGPTVGDPCTTPDDCGGQICMNEEFTPGGYCSQQCTLGVEGSCPGGTQCVDDVVARDFPGCLRICDDNGDCRKGYTCRVVRDATRAVCVGTQGI